MENVITSFIYNFILFSVLLILSLCVWFKSVLKCDSHSWYVC